MAWIDTIPLGDADGRLAELYAAALDPTTGALDHIMAIHSLHPAGLEAHLALYTAVMRGTPSLRKVDRELVALAVSAANACHYWLTHHRRGLRRLLKDDQLLARVEVALAADLERSGGSLDSVDADSPQLPHLAAELDGRRHALLVYALKLTANPAAMVRDDVERLRTAGLSDTDVLHLAEVVSYYAYVNRIADGLGVMLEG